MMKNNWLMYYPNVLVSYPFMWLKWQRTVFGNWFDIWAKTTPKVINGAGQTLTIQEQFIKTCLEIEEKTIQQSLETQKLFWQNYFKVIELQKDKIKDQVVEVTATLEQFPTSANLEPFPVSANVSN